MPKKRYCNVRRMNKLIAALKTEAAKNMFNMREWGLAPEGAKAPSEAFKAGGGCGTTACMAGIAAIIDRKYFGTVRSQKGDGVIYYHWEVGEEGMVAGFADWLGTDWGDADQLTDPGSSLWLGFDKTDIVHAINVLEAYRDGGMEKVGEIEGVILA